LKRFTNYLIYKPYRVVCQFRKDGDQKTLGELHNFPKNVYPIGRLDKDSEGLLLLSNNPALNAAILRPKKKLGKTYWVQVEGVPNIKQLNRLQTGLEIKHEKKIIVTKPCKAHILKKVTLPERIPPIRFRKSVSDSWLEIILFEGKNRQVRKMTAAIGLPTLRLVRVGIGNLVMSEMQSGKVVQLSDDALQHQIFGKL